jgi:hypothetical protein
MLSLTTKPVQLGLALSSLAVLTGCQAGEVADAVSDETSVDTPDIEIVEVEEEAPAPVAAAEVTFADGIYEAEGGYQSPNGAETVVVALTITDGVVTDAVVSPQATNDTSSRYQGQFAGGIAAEIVGVPLSELNVSRVAGSSLTGGGFNKALEQIRTQAQAG